MIGKRVAKDGTLKPLKQNDEDYFEFSTDLQCLKFADGIVLIAKSYEDAQENLTAIDNILKKYGMNLSEKKTKVQEIDNKKVWDAEQPKIFLRGKEVEKVREFVYLGSVIASDARDTADVERRLKLGDSGIARMRRTLWDKSLPQVLRVKMLSSFIYPIATYGCETWALSRVDKNKLRKWWMKILRMIYGVRWYHKVADTTILKGLASSKHLPS